MFRTAVAALAGAVLLVAGCGDDTPPPVTEDGRLTVAVEMGDLFFEPDRIEVPSGTEVTIDLTNNGAVEHDLVFEGGPESPLLSPGDTHRLELGEVTADMLGWCDVPGHRAAGMEFEIIVSG